MLITVALTSVIGLTILAWSAKRVLPFPICPICTGVSGTWLWLIAAHFLGYQIDLTVPAILMGGSVVGAMSKLERFVEPKFVLVWKTVFVIAGFLAADSLVTGQWLVLAGGIIFALVATLVFQMSKINTGKPELKNCC